MQVPATVLLISDMWFSFYKCGTFIYHNVSNVQGQCRNWWSTTIWQRVMRCAHLPWRHLRQFMRGSLRGGASQIQQTSSTPAATEANRKRQRIAGEGRKEMWERKREREKAVNSINLCILIHILATSLISVSPVPFQISLHLMSGYPAWS